MKKTVGNVGIIGNNHAHDVLSFYDLPSRYRKRMQDTYLHSFSDDIHVVLDYLDTCNYVVYNRQVYNLSDTMRYSGDLGKYDRYNSNTFFSGQLFKYSEDCEQVFCYSYYSQSIHYSHWQQWLQWILYSESNLYRFFGGFYYVQKFTGDCPSNQWASFKVQKRANNICGIYQSLCVIRNRNFLCAKK